jgi:hypothetical protein
MKNHRVDSAKSNQMMGQNINISSARQGEDMMTDDAALEN